MQYGPAALHRRAAIRNASNVSSAGHLIDPIKRLMVAQLQVEGHRPVGLQMHIDVGLASLEGGRQDARWSVALFASQLKSVLALPAWRPPARTPDGASIASIPYRATRVMSCFLTEVTVRSTVRASMSQASLSILAKVRASIPAIDPFTSEGGRAGSTSMTPGRE